MATHRAVEPDLNWFSLRLQICDEVIAPFVISAQAEIQSESGRRSTMSVQLEPELSSHHTLMMRHLVPAAHSHAGCAILSSFRVREQLSVSARICRGSQRKLGQLTVERFSDSSKFVLRTRLLARH